METLKTNQTTNIYNDLKKAILNGQLKTGHRLNESGYSKSYNASRLHVKDAFRLLENEKLAQYLEMKGFVVIGVSQETLEEVAIIRQALEEIIVKKVIQVATDDDIKAMKHIVKRMYIFLENEMYRDNIEEYKKFYEYMYQLCNYPRIIGIINTYDDYINLLISKSTTKAEKFEMGYKIIQRLMDAIENRDETTALKEIRLILELV